MYMPITEVVNNRIQIPYFKSQIIVFLPVQRHYFWSQKNSDDFIFGDIICLRSLLSPYLSSLPRPESVTFLRSPFGVGVEVICHLRNVPGVSE